MAPTQRQSLIFLAAGLATAALAALIVFSGVLPPYFRRHPTEISYAPPEPVFRIAGYDELPGWFDDDHEKALPVFLRSCEILMARSDDAPANPLENLGDRFGALSLAGRVGDWRAPCDAAAGLHKGDYVRQTAWRRAVRGFFEAYFTPVAVRQLRRPETGTGQARLEAEGVFTGYFEPVYEARRTPSGAFSAPLLARPADLVEVNLGDFKPSLAGERIAGRVEGTRLVPYADRRAINDGALDGAAAALAYLDPNDLFYLQIQGSGRLQFDDGETMRVGYDGANGRAYTSIGRLLVERGAMALEEASMKTIRQWLETAEPAAAAALRNANESYVFFRPLKTPDGLGPPGAQGAPLTPERSLAIDRRYYPLGAPVYVSIEGGPWSDGKPIRRLMIAQDTGGAIRGPVRGDVFWGAGEAAGAKAGPMNAAGELYVLLPRSRAEAIADAERAAP